MSNYKGILLGLLKFICEWLRGGGWGESLCGSWHEWNNLFGFLLRWIIFYIIFINFLNEYLLLCLILFWFDKLQRNTIIANL